MTFLTALLLADRGELDFHAPVATYWPEFAANGKEAIEVRHLMAHTAGLAGWVEPIEEADLYDWEKATSLLAAQAPLWEPGTASGYHALTQGYLVGEVIRRVTGGTTVGQLFAKEIAGPLGADFHIGTGPEHDHRVARVIPPDAGPSPRASAHLDPDSVWRSAMSAPAARRALVVERGVAARRDPRRRRPRQRPLGRPRAVGAVARRRGRRHPPPVPGRRARSSSSGRSAARTSCSRCPLTFGMGYGISSPEMPIGPNERTCFWGGWGGSIVINDLENRLTVAYVMNRMGEGTTGDDRGIGIVFAAYGAVVGAFG